MSMKRTVIESYKRKGQAFYLCSSLVRIIKMLLAIGEKEDV
ncbi:hypothetical protein BLGI_1238 [Brevibacillus laterosporus GI-9]|nr:hypothetical protein BLGI_1238 [Brevibacillus laterosporus GI-9]